MEIIVTKRFEDLRHIVWSEDNKVYQLNYIDKIGRFRKFKEIIPKEHNGSMYYRIERERYSEYKLKAIGINCYKRVDLERKVIKF